METIRSTSFKFLHHRPDLKSVRTLAAVDSREVSDGSSQRGQDRFEKAQIDRMNMLVNEPGQVVFVSGLKRPVMPLLRVNLPQEQQRTVDLSVKSREVFFRVPCRLFHHVYGANPDK